MKGSPDIIQIKIQSLALCGTKKKKKERLHMYQTEWLEGLQLYIYIYINGRDCTASYVDVDGRISTVHIRYIIRKSHPQSLGQFVSRSMWKSHEKPLKSIGLRRFCCGPLSPYRCGAIFDAISNSLWHRFCRFGPQTGWFFWNVCHGQIIFIGDALLSVRAPIFHLGHAEDVL